MFQRATGVWGEAAEGIFFSFSLYCSAAAAIFIINMQSFWHFSTGGLCSPLVTLGS
jgi:uncharacterized membrane protein YhiD involved in acid resistance